MSADPPPPPAGTPPHLAAAADTELAQLPLHARAGRVTALVVDALVLAQVAVTVQRNPDHAVVALADRLVTGDTVMIH